MKIGLFSGAYPPELDGIGDYTGLLAGELGSRHEVRVFTGFQKSYSANAKVPVLGVFDPAKPATVRGLLKAVAADPPLDRLVVQYNPFGFGPRGYNPWLPLALSRLRTQVPVSVMFHETYVPCESPAQFAMRLWQIPQFVSLCRISGPIYSSCSRWLPAIRRAAGRDAILLPVGSNIGLSKLSRLEARSRLGVDENTRVWGVFGSAHPSRLLDWICEAAKATASSAGSGSALVYIGADGEEFRRILDPGVRFIDCGLLPGDAVGDRLMAADCMLAPFIDGLSTRRGSVIAAFQHGIPVVSTSSRWTDALLLGQEELSVFLSPVHDGADGFASLTRRVANGLPIAVSRQIALKEYSARHFGWPSISAALLDGN